MKGPGITETGNPPTLGKPHAEQAPPDRLFLVFPPNNLSQLQDPPLKIFLTIIYLGRKNEMNYSFAVWKKWDAIL
jgi:hypothetical protein